MAQNFQENVWSQYKCKAYKQYMYSIISIELCWNVTLCAPTSRNYPYSTFSKSSAACLNYVKSQGLWVGSWTRRIDKPLGFKWNNEGLLFLGVHLGVSNNYVNHNWTKCKEELSKTLSRWSTLSRNLSFKGKILVANQLAASKIFHCLAILSPPHQILSELQDMLVNFIWSNKRHLLKKQILFQECDKGGLGLASLQARTLTFRMSFLQRFLSLCSHPAYDLCSYNLQKYKHLHFDFQLFLMNLEPKFYYSLPYFYSDILSAWSKCGARIETSYFSLNHVLNVPLNYSFPTSLTVSGNKVLPVRLFACGIKLVKHLIDLTNGSWLQAGDFTFPLHLATLVPPTFGSRTLLHVCSWNTHYWLPCILLY